MAVVPVPARGADVTLSVSAADATRKPVSPWIFGRNGRDALTDSGTARSLRLGGNRWTAYNWETNASNAGNDYQFYSDNYLLSSQGIGSTAPGAALLPHLQSTAAKGQAVVVTVPMAAFVSKDMNGAVAPADFARVDPANPTGPGVPGPRFLTSRATKGATLSLSPDLNDGFVNQDEYVNWVRANRGQGRKGPVIYALDNEPDLWAETHQQIRRSTTGTSSVKVTYQELRDRTLQYATMIKATDPDAVVVGPMNYGWTGYTSLQSAPDAGGRDFHTYYLQQLSAASQQAGRRLVDALSVHYYPEARGTYSAGGASRIIFDPTAMTSTDPGMVAARVNAPRSLYDPAYVEDSWITNDVLRWSEPPPNNSVKLLPRMQAKIDANYPGTRITVTEYFFGGGNHISGATAQADVLGAFARAGVYAANLWSLQPDLIYIDAAFRMYLDYDGRGSRFGDTSVSAASSDLSKASVYAAVDSSDPKRVTVIAINRTGSPLTTDLVLNDLPITVTGMHAYQLAGTNPTPQLLTSGPYTATTWSATLPAYSVTAVTFTGSRPIPEPAALAAFIPATLLLGRRR